MAKQLTYSEISDICADKRITVTKLASESGMTLHGLKSAIQNETVQSRVILSICNLLSITPNQFYNWDSDRATFNTTQVGVLNNQQIGSVGIEILQQQLAAKDEQIKQLLELLKK